MSDKSTPTQDNFILEDDAEITSIQIQYTNAKPTVENSMILSPPDLEDKTKKVHNVAIEQSRNNQKPVESQIFVSENDKNAPVQ